MTSIVVLRVNTSPYGRNARDLPGTGQAQFAMAPNDNNWTCLKKLCSRVCLFSVIMTCSDELLLAFLALINKIEFKKSKT
jgi:hypothetical protein